MLMFGLPQDNHAGVCVTDGLFETVRPFLSDQ